MGKLVKSWAGWDESISAPRKWPGVGTQPTSGTNRGSERLVGLVHGLVGDEPLREVMRARARQHTGRVPTGVQGRFFFPDSGSRSIWQYKILILVQSLGQILSKGLHFKLFDFKSKKIELIEFLKKKRIRVLLHDIKNSQTLYMKLKFAWFIDRADPQTTGGTRGAPEVFSLVKFSQAWNFSSSEAESARRLKFHPFRGKNSKLKKKPVAPLVFSSRLANSEI